MIVHFLTGVVLIGAGVLLGWIAHRPQEKEAPEELKLAIMAVNIAGLLKQLDPTLNNDIALTMGKGVVEWAQQQTT